jgi:hypothetical protein
MYFLEVHHAIGKLPAPQLADFKWEQLPLGDQADGGFLHVDGPDVQSLVDRLLTRPDIIGVRVVFHGEPATIPRTFHDTIPVETGPPIPAPAEKQIMATHGR